MLPNRREVAGLRKAVEYQRGLHAQLEQSIEAGYEEGRSDTRQMVRHERALIIVKEVGIATQKQLEYHLADQVSLANNAVFDDPYELKVNFQEKRGKSEAEILFTRRDMEMPPIGSAGGGAIDIASFALRIAYWSMRQDRRVAPILLLDEPFKQLKGVDANKRALMMVQQISSTLGIQIIMVSDERIPREDIIENADKVIHVSQRKTGVSSVRTYEEEAEG